MPKPSFDISQWYNEHDLDYRTPEPPTVDPRADICQGAAGLRS